MEDKYGTPLVVDDWVMFTEFNRQMAAKVVTSTTPNNLILAYGNNQFVGDGAREGNAGYPKLRKSVVKLANRIEPTPTGPKHHRDWRYHDKDITGVTVELGMFVTYAETASRMSKGRVVNVAANAHRFVVVTIVERGDGRVRKRQACNVGIVDNLNIELAG